MKLFLVVTKGISWIIQSQTLWIMKPHLFFELGVESPASKQHRKPSDEFAEPIHGLWIPFRGNDGPIPQFLCRTMTRSFNRPTTSGCLNCPSNGFDYPLELRDFHLKLLPAQWS